MSWHHMLEALKIICRQGPVRGIDVCELMPLPGSRLSEFVTAKLIFKLLSYLFHPLKKENQHA
jgi:arginase family enzyme